MSALHPIVAVTGSSGAGTSEVRTAFEHIFAREGIEPAVIEGDSFHAYDRLNMRAKVEEAAAEGRNLTHFGPEGNLFEKLQGLFAEYAEHGTGERRRYVHTEREARELESPQGTFTPWEPIPPGTDLLLYEGLHGGLVTDDFDVAQHVDLLIGVVPIVNLEWIQKIHRDREIRGYSAEDAVTNILRRLPDYVYYITPQFSRTDINFQRVPTVDTSNPFAAKEIPNDSESWVVINLRNRKKLPVDFRELLELIDGSFMSRSDTIVVPAGKKVFAMELIVTPVIERMMEVRGSLGGA